MTDFCFFGRQTIDDGQRSIGGRIQKIIIVKKLTFDGRLWTGPGYYLAIKMFTAIYKVYVL
jgi:hypothetical protein